MKASDLMKNPTVQTAAVAAATKDPATMAYIQMCLDMFFSGMYGQISPADGLANDEELKSGEGRVLARYEAREKLDQDIFIIAYFSESNQGDHDYNNTTVMYCSEY